MDDQSILATVLLSLTHFQELPTFFIPIQGQFLAKSCSIRIFLVLSSFGSANLPPFLWQSMTACEKLLLVLEKKNHFPFSFLQPFDFGHIPANNEMKQNK